MASFKKLPILPAIHLRLLAGDTFYGDRPPWGARAVQLDKRPSGVTAYEEELKWFDSMKSLELKLIEKGVTEKLVFPDEFAYLRTRTSRIDTAEFGRITEGMEASYASCRSPFRIWFDGKVFQAEWRAFPLGLVDTVEPMPFRRQRSGQGTNIWEALINASAASEIVMTDSQFEHRNDKKGVAHPNFAKASARKRQKS